MMRLCDIDTNTLPGPGVECCVYRWENNKIVEKGWLTDLRGFVELYDQLDDLISWSQMPREMLLSVMAPEYTATCDFRHPDIIDLVEDGCFDHPIVRECFSNKWFEAKAS